jgi:Zn-dependent protease with chaperone function
MILSILGAIMRKRINTSREMLADELCVRWTMHTEGLASALADASSHATRYMFKGLRSTWFVPCNFSYPQPSPRERISCLEETLRSPIVE